MIVSNQDCITDYQLFIIGPHCKGLHGGCVDDKC